MKSLLIAPHNDDETLFAAFHCLSAHPHVIIVLRSQVQEWRYGITAATREAETLQAMEVLGCAWEQWNHLDDDPDWALIERKLIEWRDVFDCDRVFAPAAQLNGHAHHNAIADIAARVFDSRIVTSYLTYTKAGKSVGQPVAYEPEWVTRKLAALACYRSQSSLANCAEHFLREQFEYVA